MANSRVWGELLRELRQKAGYLAQDNFADALAEAGLFISTSTLYRYETDPGRIPKNRQRHLELIKALAKAGGLEEVAEANAWLELAGQGFLSPSEQQDLFGEQIQPKPLIEQAKSDGDMATSSGDAPKHDPLSDEQQGTSSFPGRTILATLIILVAVMGIFAFISRPTSPPSLTPTHSIATASPLPATPMPENIINRGFESGELAPWFLDGVCEMFGLQIEEVRSEAYEGTGFLSIATDNPDCYSFRQDSDLVPVAGEEYTFSIRARSSDGSPRRVSLVIWSGIGGEETFTYTEEQNASNSYLIGGDEWHCLETTLTLTNVRNTVLRTEVYLDTQDGVDYYFDDAILQPAGAGECEPPLVTSLENGDFEESFTYPWESPDDCAHLLLAGGLQPFNGSQYLVVSRTDNPCNSFYQKVYPDLNVGDTYNYSIWVQASDHLPHTMEIVLWAEGGGQEKSVAHYTIGGSAWQCMETSLTLQNAGQAWLRAQVYFHSPNGSDYYFDNANLEIQEQSTCPKEEGLQNGSFENSLHPFPWMRFVDCEQVGVVVNHPQEAYAGQNFYVTQRGDDRCVSFIQDFAYGLAQGETYYFSIWARSPNEQPREAGLTIWTMGSDNQETEGALFTVDSTTWQCFEVALTLQEGHHHTIRSEVYLHTPDVDYYFDQASFGAERVCPETDLDVQQVEAVTQAPFYTGSMIGVETAIRNSGETDIESGLVNYWVSDIENGEPIDLGFKKSTPLGSLAAGDSTGTLYADVSIPLHLAEGMYYIVVEVDTTQAIAEINERNNRLSQPFFVSACSPDTLFCDIPAGHWAQVEVERWYPDITDGCRSAGVEYENLPFCPNQIMDRGTFAVFLMRHLMQANYQPTEPYAGYFADLPEGHSRAPWVEDLYRMGIVLDTPSCPNDEDVLYFCPDLPLTRGDFARYMAMIREWDVQPVAGDIFSDLPTDELTAQAIEYMWVQGYFAENDPDCEQPEEGWLFCPDKPMRRAQAAVFMVRIFEMLSEATFQ